MSCPDCTLAAEQGTLWPGHTAGCKGCDARALARVFLAHGERGRRFLRACEQLGVEPEAVHAAYELTKEAP